MDMFEVVVGGFDFEGEPLTYAEAVEDANSIADRLVSKGWTADRSWASRENTYAIRLTLGERVRTLEVLRFGEDS